MLWEGLIIFIEGEIVLALHMIIDVFLLSVLFAVKVDVCENVGEKSSILLCSVMCPIKMFIFKI